MYTEKNLRAVFHGILLYYQYDGILLIQGEIVVFRI